VKSFFRWQLKIPRDHFAVCVLFSDEENPVKTSRNNRDVHPRRSEQNFHRFPAVEADESENLILSLRLNVKLRFCVVL
jgi:hypothetical protein